MAQSAWGQVRLVSPLRQHWVLPLPPQLESPFRARTFLRSVLGGGPLTQESIDTVLLLASELVTNAALHGRSDMVVEVTLSELVLHVSVADENSRLPRARATDLSALDGRGMALVEALASRHGVEVRAIGKAVWFELDR